jgi:3-hydroxyacyl-[acyl-carrier-protein] dehydratase
MQRRTRENMMYLEEIKSYLPHRYPFLLVDRILELEPGISCKAIKNVTGNEDFFNGHFPGRPIMPGVLIVEAMAQTCGILAYSVEQAPETKFLLFAGIDKTRFKAQVVPGDQLVMDVEWLSRKLNVTVFQATARVDGKVAAQGELRMALIERPD